MYLLLLEGQCTTPCSSDAGPIDCNQYFRRKTSSKSSKHRHLRNVNGEGDDNNVCFSSPHFAYHGLIMVVAMNFQV
jgi:hypothetical protein